MRREAKIAVGVIATALALVLVWISGVEFGATDVTSRSKITASNRVVDDADPAAPSAVSKSKDAGRGELALADKASPSPPREAIEDLDVLSIAELVARADRGNARAACRAARQLYDCTFLKAHPVEQLAQDLNKTEQSFDANREAANANRWAQVQLRMLEAADRCKSAPPETHARLGILLRRAALQGNRGAMLKYASGEFLGVSPGPKATRHPGYATWRSEALPMLLRSARAGSNEAVFTLWNAYNFDESALEALVLNDPVEAHVYNSLFRLAKGEKPVTSKGLTAMQHEEALRRAHQLHKEIFAGGLAETEEGVLGPSWWNAGADPAHEPCR